jgi:hypothetical protein
MQTTHFLLLLVCFFTLVAGAQAIDETSFITTAQEIPLAQGRLYIDYLNPVVEDDVFTIRGLFYPEVATGTFTLYREQSPLLPIISGSEIGDDEAYFYIEWVDTLRRNSTYVLEYVVEESVVLQEEFSVAVLPKPIDSQARESYPVLHEESASAVLETTRQLLSEKNIVSLTPQELRNYKQTAKASILLNKTRIIQETHYEDGTIRNETIIVVTLLPTSPLDTIYVVEHIPKSFASTTSQLYTSTPFIVLEKDPVILWQLEDVAEPVNLSYTVEKSTDITGNTVLLAIAKEEPSASLNWKLLAPLLFIPFIALLILYGTHFTSSKRYKRK